MNTDFCGKPCRMYLHPRKLTHSWFYTPFRD
jgi:hypothetical protein